MSIRNLPHFMLLLLLIAAGGTWIEGTGPERLWFGVGLSFGVLIGLFIWIAEREN